MVAFWLLLNGFEFLPFIILIIYVGSIAVLFLFVVMIINPDYAEMRDEFFNIKYLWYRQDLKNLNSNETPAVNTKLSSVVTQEVLQDLKSTVYWEKDKSKHDEKSKLYYLSGFYFWSFAFFCAYFAGFMSTELLFSRFYGFEQLVFLNSLHTDNLYVVFGDVYYIANLLYVEYGLDFVLMGFILFVAMVGVIMFGVKKSLIIKRQNLSEQFFRYR